MAEQARVMRYQALIASERRHVRLYVARICRELRQELGLRDEAA